MAYEVFDSTDMIGEFFGKSHIPPNYVVERVTAQRKPPEVRICRLRNQSRVGTVGLDHRAGHPIPF
jgi:hypothetical protein